MIRKRGSRYALAWYAGVFVFLFIWFSQIHPLVIYDADDWTYLSYVRKATPIWGDWNPARVFPEIFMPLCSRAAIYVLKPLVGDFITALTAMNALIAALLITGYVWSFGNLMKSVFSLSSSNTIFISALFLIFHFLVFRSESVDNTYLFYCHDVTCYYNYLFPSLLNASVVMFLMRKDREKTGSAAKQGMFLLVVYLAIFSHLPASGILAVYALCRLLLSLVNRRGEKFQILMFAKQEWSHIAILSAWLVCAIFELFGGNATGMRETPFLQSLKETLKGLLKMVPEGNRIFIITSAVIMILAVSLALISKSKKPRSDADRQYFSRIVTCGACLIVMFAYIWVLYAKAGARYAYRSDCSRFGIVFYGFLILMLSFGYVVVKCPKVVMVMPLVLCILAFEADTTGRTFLESNPTNIDAAVSAEISRDLIDQVVRADQAGQTQMRLYVPVSDSSDNWPHSLYMGDRIQTTLYAYRLISRPMTITVVPSEEMNEKYHLPVPVPCSY